MGEYGLTIHLQNDDDKVYPLEGKKTGRLKLDAFENPSTNGFGENNSP